MKMAKASDADMEMAIELTNALENLASQWGALMPEKIEVIDSEGESERFDIDDHEQCKRALEYLILLTRSASLFRVVFGMTVLLDPRNKIVDPDVGTLEHHPDVAKTKEQRDGLLNAVNALLHQIDIGDFVDSHGHSAKMLKPVHDLLQIATEIMDLDLKNAKAVTP